MNINRFIKFVLTHPFRERAYPGWSNEQISMSLVQRAMDGDLYAVGEKNSIEGLIIADIHHDRNEIFIENIITSKPRAIARLVREWAVRYPGFTVSGNRDSRRRTYSLRNFRRFLPKSDDKLVPTSVSL